MTINADNITALFTKPKRPVAAPRKETLKGDKGEKGERGERGLKGDKGEKGDRGERGLKGDKGDAGKDGKNGIDGKDGKSAYELWLENGGWGDESEFLKSLKGKSEFVRTGSVGAGLPLGGNKNDVLVRNDTGLAGSSLWKAPSLSFNKIRITSSDTLTSQYLNWFVNTDSSDVTLTIEAGQDGQYHRIVNTGTSFNTLTLSPSGVNLIGSTDTFILNDGESLIITYDATDGWY